MKRIARNLFKHQNGTYYTITRVGETQIKRSLHTSDKTLAQKLLKQVRLNGGVISSLVQSPPTETQSKDMRPLFLDAVNEHERHSAFASPKTLINFRTRKNTMLRFCGTWEDFQPVVIWKNYKTEGEEKRRAQEQAADLPPSGKGWVSAPNQLRWYLRSFSDFCVNRKWLTLEQVCGKIPRLAVPPRRVQIPSPHVVSDLLGMCEAEHEECGQFLRFLAVTGLRLTGGRNIRWEEINFDGGEYRRLMKGGNEVVIPLLPEALSFLKKRWEAAGRPKTGLVFQMGDCRIKKARRILKKYAVGLGLGLSYPHALSIIWRAWPLLRGSALGKWQKCWAIPMVVSWLCRRTVTSSLRS